MRIVYAGTPEFACWGLRALLDAGHEVVGVLTQPDRPSGRGMKTQPSAVKQVALDAGIPVFQPLGLRLDGKFSADAAAARHALLDLQPALMVVAAYGLILPQWVLDLPAHGCLNIHASLLPRWRGAAPIQRAIEAGDTRTGVTIMQMDAGLDTGDMLGVREVPIGPDDTAATLHDALARVGGEAIVAVVAHLIKGELHPQPQPLAGVTYAVKLQKSEAALDFTQSAAVLERRIRAFDPFPGTTMQLPGMASVLKVWRAQVLANEPATEAVGAVHPAVGTILRADGQGIDVVTADGVLRILVVQKAGSKRQTVAQFMQNWTLP
ncbi:methionyl-tRNA formyltransferase [Alcaligenaceae bacterium CGII-47]|nr:methionyl-tRNA formyltransferase [Alcaligenaceae bacterium CGII-47]